MLGRVFVRTVTNKAMSEALPTFAGKSYPVPNTPRFQKFMEMQSFYLKEDGSHIWYKSSTDKLRFWYAATTCGIATLFSVYTLSVMVAKPEN